MHGATLFKTLLNSYTLLKESGYVLSSMQPSNVYITQDAKELQFTDLLSMTKREEKAMHSIRCEQPYCCFDDFTEYKMARSDPMLDMHALCMILLEILVGTDVILSCGCWENVEDLITVCEDYIDVDTAKLLHDLCKHSSDKNLKYYKSDKYNI